jgi:hypothetical protein
MDFKHAYEWGDLFASPWEEMASGMRERASAMGLTQVVKDAEIYWQSEDISKVKFCFVQDPSDIEGIPQIFTDEENVSIPVCFIVVRQPDASEKRGDMIFDILRMNSDSNLWRFSRVYTPPRKRA